MDTKPKPDPQLESLSSDTERLDSAPRVVLPPSEPATQPVPLPVGASGVVNEPPVPYLASLGAFIVLFISTFYSLIGLVGYTLDKLIVSHPEKATDATAAFAGSFSNMFVIGQVATLLICLPAALGMAILLRRYETSETWRLQQKWRRALYSIGALFLIFALVSTFITFVYSLFYTNLELSQPSFSSIYSSSSQSIDAPDKSAENTKTVLQWLFNSIILGAGLFTLGSHYTGRRKQITWIVFAALGFCALILAPYSVFSVSQSINDQKAKIEEQRKKEEAAKKQREDELNKYRYDSSSYKSSSSSRSSNLYY